MRLTQSIDYAAIGPPVVIAATAVVVLVADLFLPVRARLLTAYVAMAGSLAALACTAWLATGSARRTFCLPGGACSYVADDYALFFQIVVLASLVVVLLISVPLLSDRHLPAGEYSSLLLASVSGMLVLAAARDLLTLLIALEVVSLPAFVLVGLRRGDARGIEAALKFFVFSVVSTALTVYGIALVYGTTGSIELDQIARALAHRHEQPGAMSATAAAGVVLVVVGFAFKVAAVPFHFWAPDTYQGAPVPVAAFLSVASKAAGFAGLIVVLVRGFGPYADIWGPAVAIFAVLSMTIGNLVALRQWQVVRLLAWSTVAQAGYLLVPLGVAATARGRTSGELHDAVQATLTYLGIYAAMNLGAFVAVAIAGRGSPRLAITDLRGLVRRSPVVAVALAFFLTALAGLPPGVAGLFAKVTVLREAVHGDVTWLAVVAAVNTVIGLAYYLRLAASLFLEPDAGAPQRDDRPTVRGPSWPLHLGLGLTVGMTALLSVYPQPLFHLADLAAR